jgi:hypothetical protein
VRNKIFPFPNSIYVDRQGLNCPFCGSAAVSEHQDFLLDSDMTLKMKVICFDCSKVYYNVFELVGYTEHRVNGVKQYEPEEYAA